MSALFQGLDICGILNRFAVMRKNGRLISGDSRQQQEALQNITAADCVRLRVWSEERSISVIMKNHAEVTLELMELLDRDGRLKRLVEKSIALAEKENPDHGTNPVRSLDEFYDYIDFTLTAMPWTFLPEERYERFVTKVDQSCLYIYFLLDRPLKELEGELEFRPSVQFLEPIYVWLRHYNNALKQFLDTEESWKPEYYEMLYKDPSWHLDQGWFEDPSNWHTFNQFFSRRLKNADESRPLAGAKDDSVVAAPGDSLPQGTWEIDEKGRFFSPDVTDEHGVVIKTSTFYSVETLLGEAGAPYAKHFYGGTLTHTFFNFDDYHRAHCPVSGTVIATYVIKNPNAVGGITTWEPDRQMYVLESCFAGWQAYETRGCVLIETDKYGLVAVFTVGQGQVSSVHVAEGVVPGAKIKKGDELGYFLFGGSDCAMLFEKKAGFELTCPPAPSDDTYANGYAKVLCRAQYGVFHGEQG